MKKPIILIIMDGFGLNPDTSGNAVSAARTPNIDRYLKTCPNTTLGASGMDVGLPDGQMGNSEVGHTNIGAGRVVYQELTRISKAIDDGEFFDNSVLSGAVDNCLKNKTALHLMGLLSDGGVHSHNTHLYALLEMAARKGLKDVYVHCFMDGRDVPPTSGRGFIEELQQRMQQLGVGRIATVMGRYYAMDREKKWDRVQMAYDAIVNRGGRSTADAAAAVQTSYDSEITDEFVKPLVVEGGAPLLSGDSVVFFNFRPDRARELTRSLVDPEFDGFVCAGRPENLYYVCMTRYDATMPNVRLAYIVDDPIVNNFGEVISKKGMRQYRIAEYTKYAHVTYFFNGGTETPYPGEDRLMIESPNVATYDLKPEMSAYEVADALLSELSEDKYDVVILNFANCDMVGHTGVFDAAVKAVETVDTCVARVVDKILSLDGIALITADHGNADKMLEDDGVTPFTAHTTNPVPLIVVGADGFKLRPGKLADIAPTMLDLLGMEKPEEMDGSSLIVR